MPPVTLSRVVALLKRAGYKVCRRRKYPWRNDAYFYLFRHRQRPLLGFPVVQRTVLHSHFTRIKRLIERPLNEEGQDQDGRS